jgi:tetratricopeptide (TPR) repeat protein
MLTIKNPLACFARGIAEVGERSAPQDPAQKSVGRWAILIFLAFLLSGCSPPGPRAVMQGKRLIEEGRYAEAVEKLRTASSLLQTNAQVWNYLGLACQYSGQSADAEKAYRTALRYNQDLSEAHYNLGCLCLEQNRLDAAKTEFIAYTLRRGNSSDGFARLGIVQLRSKDLAAAEKSFSDALRLNGDNAAALNGVGLVRVQRARPAEAAQYFESASKKSPGYYPAILNQAVVAQVYFKDKAAALQHYHNFLAHFPKAPGTELVLANTRQLEAELRPPAVVSPPNSGLGLSNSSSRAAVTNTVSPRITAPAKTNSGSGIVRASPTIPANTQKNVSSGATSQPPISPRSPVDSGPVETVKLSSEPVLKIGEDLPASGPRAAQSPKANSSPPPSTGIQDHPGSPRTAAPQRGVLQKINPLNWFHGEGRVPVPVTRVETGDTRGVASNTGATTAPATVQSPRYRYKGFATPLGGDRTRAEPYFSQGVQSQQARRLKDAMLAYEKALQIDPAYFEAQYNLGLAASQNSDLPGALVAYEKALAIQPDSTDARYNFGLALSQAGYLEDAANQFEKIVAKKPDEARAHLALGNMYAQQFHDPARARPHYLKVIETDPRNSQAAAIRFWLTENPR